MYKKGNLLRTRTETGMVVEGGMWSLEVGGVVSAAR
jgi:hypothetical protein